MSEMRNLWNIDISDDDRALKDFEKKRKRTDLINRISMLLQRRIYKYTLPSLERFRRAIQCYCTKAWPGSVVEILAMKDEYLMDQCKRNRRGMDMKIKFPSGSIRQECLTVSGIIQHEV